MFMPAHAERQTTTQAVMQQGPRSQSLRSDNPSLENLMKRAHCQLTDMLVMQVSVFQNMFVHLV